MVRNVSVLVVERDPMLLFLESEFIEKIDGFEVCGKATSLKELEHCLRCGPQSPDLVIMEPFLPHNATKKILGLLRSLERWPEMIVVSLCSETSEILQTCLLGVFDYIIKPFSLDRLQQSLINFRNYFTHRSSLPKIMSQEDIDRFFQHHTSTAEAPFHTLPKNLHSETLNCFLEFLHRTQTAVSAEEIAEKTGLSRSTAWRYLHFLLETGHVQCTQEWGKTGRPTTRFYLRIRRSTLHHFTQKK